MPVPDILVRLTGSPVLAALLLYGAPAVPILILLLVLWFVFGYGPRRRRGLKRARLRLKDGAWQDAVERVRKLRNLGLPSKSWQKTFDQFFKNFEKQVSALALKKTIL